MARSATARRTLIIRHPVKVTVEPLKIERAKSLAYLDVAKLGKAAKAQFDLGEVKVDGCRSAVRAIVRKGMVVGIAIDGCVGCGTDDVADDVLALLKSVQRKLGTGKGPDRPVPVEVFLRQVVPERSRCHMFCFLGRCYICCGFPSDISSWSCGRVGRTLES
jgi:hypothetical protein